MTNLVIFGIHRMSADIDLGFASAISECKVYIPLELIGGYDKPRHIRHPLTGYRLILTSASPRSISDDINLGYASVDISCDIDLGFASVNIY